MCNGTLEQFAVCDYAEDMVSFTVPPGDEPAFGWLGLDCEIDVEVLGARPKAEEPQRLG